MTAAWYPKNRFSLAKLEAFIRAGIRSGAVIVSGRLPSTPNRVIGITPVQGPRGDTYEGIFEVAAFRIECRGAENNLRDAEAIAFDVDNVIINCPDNFELGGPGDSVFCNEMGRTGGAPAMQTTLPDDRSRFVYTCSYFANVSTNLGG